MRLKGWQLQIVVNSTHRFGNATSIALRNLKEERFVLRTYCEWTSMVFDFPRAQDVNIALLEAGVGVALLPRSMRFMVEKLESVAPSISMAWPAGSARQSPPHQ